MTCRQLDELISFRLELSELPPSAAEHLATCERCGRLVRALRERQEAAAPSTRRLQQIQSKLLKDLKPVRPISPRYVFLIALGLLFLVGVLIGSRLLGVAGWNALSGVQRVAMFTVSVVGGILLVISLAREMVPGSGYSMSAVRLPGAVLGALAIATVAVFRPQPEPAFVSTGLMCLRIGMTYSMPAALLSWLILRGGAMLSPRRTGIAAGVFAGLIGVTVLEVYCPNLNMYHVAVWHLGVILLTALAGVVLGVASEHIYRRRAS